MKKIKRAVLFSLLLLVVAGLLGGASLFAADHWIAMSAESRLYSSADSVPAHDVALLLGTSRHLVANGNINPYYRNRIEAVKRLWDAGSIAKVIVSGDNSQVGYDEPTQMRDDLVALGLPADKIWRDYAGFRTLDSIARAKQVFGQSRILIVSQRFHNERALWLADHYGIEADAFNAEDVRGMRLTAKVSLREKFARVLCLAETFLHFDTPKFGGPPVDLNHPEMP